MRPVRISPPAALPVTREDIKAHTRIDTADEDSLIDALLGGAVAYLDGYAGLLGRCLLAQTWQQSYTDWAARLRLPFPDVDPDSVQLTYLDADGAEQSVDPSLYELIERARGAEIVFRDTFSEPGLDDDREAPVSVTFEAGYGAAEDVPAAIKVAIMMLVSHWYEHREAVSENAGQEVPLGVKALIAPYRMVGL